MNSKSGKKRTFEEYNASKARDQATLFGAGPEKDSEG